MGRPSKRTQQLKGNADKARKIRLGRISKDEDLLSKIAAASKNNSKIIINASKRSIKSKSSHPFSRLMRIQKQSNQLKKLKDLEKLKRMSEDRQNNRILRMRKIQEEATSVEVANGFEVENGSKADEVMNIHMSENYVEILLPNNIRDSVISTSPEKEDNDLSKAKSSEFIFKPKKNVKCVKKRSMYYRIRKLRQLAEEMTGGAAYVNSPNQGQKLPLQKQAELLFAKKLKSRQIDHMAKLTKKCFTYKNLMKKLKPILEKFPVTVTDDGKLNISLIVSMKERLKNMLHKLPKNKRIRVTIVADKGEKITKICYFFNDVEKPEATENLGVLSLYFGDDDSDSIQGICESLNQEMLELITNGLICEDVRQDFEFFITGDCKSICSMLGVQGGSALKFCHHCLTTDNCIIGSRRTVNGITEDARRIVHEIARRQLQINQIVQIRNIRKANNSVLHEPFFQLVDLDHIIPPALHLLMSLVNKLIEYFKSSRYFYILDLN